MRIEKVTYRRLQTLSGYNNECVEATALVEPEDTPESALGQLKQWVGEQLGCQEQLNNVRTQLFAARCQLSDVRCEVDALERRKMEIADGIRKLNDILTPVREMEQLPF